MKTRTGTYGGNKTSADVPDRIIEAFNDEDPSWDWMSTAGYVVLRQYDDGVETDRILAKIIKERVL